MQKHYHFKLFSNMRPGYILF